MSPISVIICGNSHLSSVVQGLKDRKGEVSAETVPVIHRVFNTIKYGIDYQFTIDAGGGHLVPNPHLDKLIDEEIPSEHRRAYVSMFGGNAHNALTLLEMDEPFDVILPSEPDLPRLPGRRLIPYDAVRAFIEYQARFHIMNTSVMSQRKDGPLFHIESPPPIGDNHYVSLHLENYFKEQGDRPITPPLLRYKLWRVHSQIVREACEAYGVTFIPAPDEGMLDGKWLRPEGYSGDSTHAGEWYGRLICQQIEERLGGHYGGWLWL